jgi:transposase
LPENHLAWFVIDAVKDIDLGPFYARYRQDGWGRAAYDPAMMVAIVLYAYAKGQRSSRGIERACVEDVAYRVIAANLAPDHVTISRFRSEHSEALAGLFSSVLTLCARAGMVKVGTIAVDGTKVHANASGDANADFDRIAREILKEAAEVDAAEDELYGEKRGDELPEHLSTSQGRRGWLREAKRQLDEERAKDAKPVPRSRPARLKEAKRRLEEELWVESRANAAYEHYRVHGRDAKGRRLGALPKPYEPPATPAGKVNLTDPDSRMLKASRGYLQGYNAQAVVTENQIVIAAEVTVDSPDFGHLQPILDAAQSELQAAGVTEAPGVLLADAGYWHQHQMENIINRGIQVLVPPDAGNRKGTRPGWNGGAYEHMRRVLQTDVGRALYRKRQAMIEPVFGQTKFNRRIDRFQRRGRSAARSEWRLITATHNLLKLHSHQIAAAGT